MEHATRPIVKKILAQEGIRLMIAITGGGLGAYGELTRHGGASKVFMGGFITYDSEMTKDFIRGTPDHYCSEPVARAMAVRSFEEAIRLKGGIEQSIGVGVTASLATPGEREGRRHRVFIAAHTHNYTRSEAYFITPAPRSEQEEWVEQHIMEFIGLVIDRYKGDPTPYPYTLLELPRGVSAGQREARVDASMVSLMFNGTPGYDRIAVRPGCRYSPLDPMVVYSGAFNPLHDKHLEIVRRAKSITGQSVALELTARNVDKPRLDYITVRDRTKSLTIETSDHPEVGWILLSTAGTYVDKSIMYPNGTLFVVGSDTINRIANPKYWSCGWSEELDVFHRNRNRFMVFPRKNHPINIPDDLMALCQVVEDYEDNGISSTHLRQERTNEFN